jgi:hypothetical protein
MRRLDHEPVRPRPQKVLKVADAPTPTIKDLCPPDEAPATLERIGQQENLVDCVPSPTGMTPGADGTQPAPLGVGKTRRLHLYGKMSLECPWP